MGTIVVITADGENDIVIYVVIVPSLLEPNCGDKLFQRNYSVDVYY